MTELYTDNSKTGVENNEELFHGTRTPLHATDGYSPKVGRRGPERNTLVKQFGIEDRVVKIPVP